MSTDATQIKKVSDTIIVDRGLARSVAKVHGANPALLIEKIIRERILDSLYWQSNVCNLNLLSLLDECCLNVELIGTYSNSTKTRPTKFICLLLRLLQLQPKRVILEYLTNGEHGFKYLVALAATYCRLVLDSKDVYSLLEPLLNDRRKLRIYKDGKTILVCMDQFIDELLNTERFCDLIIPRLISRWQLEEQDILEPRESELMSEFEEEIEKEEEDKERERENKE